ncbi:MAG: thrombospondin type 3 repeat-containing protein [bacterium]
MNKNLIKYIQKQKDKGVDEETIRNSLLANNWREKAINKALAQSEVKKEENPKKESNIPDKRTTTESSTNEVENVEKKQKPSSKNNKLFLIVTIIALAIVLLGGSTYAYFYFQTNPNKIIAEMITNISDIKSLTYDNTVTLKISDEFLQKSDLDFNLSKNTEVSLSVAGKTNLIDPEAPAADFNIGLAGLEELNTSGFGLSLKIVDKELYFKISGIEELLKQFNYDSLLDYVDEWITVKGEAVEDLGINYDKQIEERVWEYADRTKIKDIIGQEDLFTIQKSYSGEQIKNEDVYHFDFAINEEAIINIYSSYLQSVTGELPDDERINDMKEQLDQIEFKNGEIWIAKSDKLPRKINLDIEISEDNEYAATVSYQAKYSDFNKDTEIEKPSNPVGIDEIMAAFQNTMLYENNYDYIPQYCEDDVIYPDSDNDGLNDCEEFYVYMSDEDNPDSDGDGYTDGEEVTNGYNPIGEGLIFTDPGLGKAAR